MNMRIPLRKISNLVSVIITTKNEQDVLEKLLQSIKNQSYQNLEIILIDNNSTDRTKQLARRYTDKIYDFGPERSAQRNYGAKKAKGKYLLFLDADMELTKKVIEECVILIESKKNIGGIAIPEKSKAVTFWEKIKAYERSFYNEKGDPITDAARFFKKKVFRSSGGYDETITGPEDWDLPETIREMGFGIERSKSSIYHRERVSSLLSLSKKKFYYARFAYRYLKKHDIPIIGPKTIYFLRPVFYKNLSRIIAHPILSSAMIVMLSTELIGGALGYLLGRFKRL